MDIKLTDTDFHILMQNSQSFRQAVIEKFLSPRSTKLDVLRQCIGLTKIPCMKAIRSAFLDMSLNDIKNFIEEYGVFVDSKLQSVK